ncbi:LamG-like jellyroll fold domain-containing protein [Streptomyces sp. NPDC127098]|uniref:LamG-like jellyroll fold domain-containing protein n=1 Tax=Streptomyces sp. NPDC127098 TaxID=3347137 RepID=UPI00364E2159
MAVLTALDPGTAAAASRWAAATSEAAVEAGEAPDQEWGSADGLSHEADAGDTTADGDGSGAEPGEAPGQLPLEESQSTSDDLGDTAPPLESGDPEVIESLPPGELTGFDEETSVELPEERTEDSRTFLNTDGTFTTRYYNEPVNYPDLDGGWQTIDTSLIRAAGGESWETAATEAGVSFGAVATDDPLMTLRLDADHAVGYALAEANAVPGEVEGPLVTYRDVRPSADVEFLGGNAEIKETIVLHDADAPTEWRFPLNLDGLTAALDEHGGIVFADAEGTVRAHMPPGWMEDSAVDERSGDGAITGGVSYELTSENGRQVLVVTLDQEWLSDPARVYPVRVDPSVTRVEASSSTYVQRPYNINFSTDTILKAGTPDGGDSAATSFLRFSGVQSSLRNAWVLDARLALYNSWSYSCNARPVTIHPITQNWSASTLAQYPGPNVGAALATDRFAHGWRPAGTNTWACDPAWETIPLGSAGRQLVDDWTHGRRANYGLAVRASTTDSYGWKQFGSTRYPNGAPSLDVTWTKYGATYRLGQLTQPVTAVSEGVQRVTVTNQGQETWPAGGQFKLRYNLYDADGNELTDSSMRRYTEMPEAVSPGESVTLNARIAPLTPGTYTVDWTMTDYGVTRFTSQGIPGARVRLAAVNIPPELTGASPGSGVTVDTLTPTLWAEGSDRDHYPNERLQFTFEVCEVDGENTRKNCRTGNRTNTQQWAVPSGWLSWDKTYAWYAYAYDGQASSLRPNPSLFSTRVPQPAVTGHLGGSDGREFNAVSGNYATSATDAALTTVGPPLAVTRTYNSLDPRADLAFGPGWTTRWDMRATAEPDGSVVVTLAEGNRVRFGRNSNGSYAGPSGGSLTLTAASGGGWVLRDATGATHTFNASGQLAKVADTAGREQRLTHTSGRLATVTDALSGRTLTFTWRDNRVASVTTNAVAPGEPGLTWNYGYTGGRLTSVCPPGTTDECTRYTYEDGSLYRSAVLDAGPVSYWRLDEAEGATAASSAPSRTGFNDAEYYNTSGGTPGALAGTGDTAASFDGTDTLVRLPHDTLRTTTFLTVELWFRTTQPGVLMGFQSQRLEDGRPESWTPPLTVDANGKLSGYLFTGDRGNITPIRSTATVTDGAWHHAVLTAEGTTQTLYLDGRAVGTLTGAIDHLDMAYTYLGAGYSSSGFDGIASGVRRFTGDLDEVAVYHRALDATTIAEHHALRQPAGRLTEVTLPSGRTHATNTYDDATSRVAEHTDADGGTWQVSQPTFTNGSSTYADTVRTGNPTGYWRLTERSGVVAASALGDDTNGSYLDGVRPGGPGPFADGDTTAPYFTGEADSAVEVPTEAWGDTSAQTVELWFRTTDSGVLVSMQNQPLGTTPTSWWPMLLVDEDGRLRGRFRNNGSDTTLRSREPVDDGRWHHVALTGNADAQVLFIDGDYQAHNTHGTTASRLAHTYLGGGYSSDNWDGQPNGYRNFIGQIAEVALYDSTWITHVSDSGIGWTNHGDRRVSAATALVSGTGNDYRAAVMGDGAAAYWRFNENGGSTAYDEGGRHHATLEGTLYRPSLGVFGAGDGRAIQGGSNGAVRMPGDILAGTTELSAELWFRTMSTTASGVLMAFQNTPLGTTPTSWRTVLNIGTDGRLRGQWWTPEAGGATPITSEQAVNDNEWHHVVLSGSGDTQTLYLDGVEIGDLAGNITDQSRPYAYLGAGYASSGWMGVPAGTYHFGGLLDEVALYRHALSAEDVAAHYSARVERASSALGATVTVTNPLGDTTDATYDALRGYRVTSVTDAEDGTTTYAYDTGGFLHTVTDPNGNATITGHDERGNTVSSTTCRGPRDCQTSYADHYLNASNPLDPRNDKPTATADARSTGPTDATYRTTTTYTTLGLPETTRLPDGRTTRRTYTTGTEPAVGGGTTPPGLLATDVQPDGATTRYAYYASGDVARTTQPSGLALEYTYDGLGRRLTETEISDAQPEGVTTTFTYDALSRVTTETGATTENAVTGEDHTAQVTRTYDPDGNILTETVADLGGDDPDRVSQQRYDDHGRVDRVIDPENGVSYYLYDDLGRLAQETDPAGTVLRHTYTPRGQHATTVLQDWTGDPSGEIRDLTLVSNAYDPAGRLATTTDAMGAVTAYRYFGDGLTATVTAQDVTGTRDIVLEDNTYDRAGNLVRQATGNGTTVTEYEVDTTGRVTTTVLDPDGLNRRTVTTYDDADRPLTVRQLGTSETDFLSTTYTYDPAGNPLSETVADPNGQSASHHTYDQRGLLTSSTTPRGHTTDYTYDALGRPVAETAPEVDGTRPETRTGYNAFGDATEQRDPLGAITRLTYDRLGQPTAVTRPEYTAPGGQPITATEETVYDVLGRPVATTDALGRTTRYAYDQLGNLITRTDPDPGTEATGASRFLLDPPDLELADTPGSGSETHYAHTPTGLLLSTTDPTGARTEATYDPLGRQLTATVVERHPTPRNLTSTYTWDDAGNQTESRTAEGVVTQARYNPAGELTGVLQAGAWTTVDRDPFGREARTTTGAGYRTDLAYNHLGQVVRTEEYGRGETVLRTTSAEYDADGNQVAAVSGSGTETTYRYDVLGRLTEQTQPVDDDTSATVAFGYDAAGNRTRMTDARGNTTEYTYTPWGQLESTIEPATDAHPDPADRTWTTVYDAAGQPVTELLPGGVRRDRTYDDLGRLVLETGAGAEADTMDRRFTYDAAGRMTSQATNEVAGIDTYTYNDRGQLLTADGPSGTTQYAYDRDGRMTERTDAAGTITFGHNDRGQLSSAVLDATTNYLISYSYDRDGRPTAQTFVSDVPADGARLAAAPPQIDIHATRSFTYDALGRQETDRLVVDTDGAEVASTRYAYDLDDRLTEKETTGTAGAGLQTYGYDLAGHLTSWTSGEETTTYAWDLAGNRVAAGDETATFDERNRLTSVGDTTYTYTPRGTLASVGDRTLTHDAFERRITDGDTTYRYDSLDRVTHHGDTAFTYDGGSNNVVSDGTSLYVRAPEGALLTTDGDPVLTNQHTDVVATLTDRGATLEASRAYDPFGQVTASDGTSPNLGYQSGWTDPATGDVNMAARWYQPGTGAFASRDTWNVEPNRYAYAGGSPLNGTDPSGHYAVAPCAVSAPTATICLGAGAGGAVGGPPGAAIGAGAAAVVWLGVGAWSWWRASSYSSSSGGYYPNAFGSLSGYNSSAAARVQAQAQAQANAAGRQALADWLRQFLNKMQNKGNSGPGTAQGLAGSWGGAGGSSTGGLGTSVITPPPPPPPQNPNRGPNPAPAPAQPAPVPHWDRDAGRWTLSQGWDMILHAQDLLGLLDQGRFSPETAEAGDLASDSSSGSGTSQDRRRDCRRAGRGWVDLYDTDDVHGGRATGIRACLDAAYLEENKGSYTTSSVRPPGYEWAQDYARYLRFRLPIGEVINNCHLLGRQLTGSGTDLRNLATCTRQANVSVLGPGRIEDHMLSVENQVHDAVTHDRQIVDYTVTPHYAGERTVPVGFEMTAIGVTADGRPGIRIHMFTPNSFNSPREGWRNIGTVSHSRTRQPVPTGPTP